MMWTMVTTTLKAQIGCVLAGDDESCEHEVLGMCNLMDKTSIQWVKERLLARKVETTDDDSSPSETNSGPEEAQPTSSGGAPHEQPSIEGSEDSTVSSDDGGANGEATSSSNDALCLPADLDTAMIAFVKTNEAELAGASMSLAAANELFAEFCRSHEVPTIKAASRTKHDLFVRTLFGKTCASRSLVRDGLIVERHVKFAALPTVSVPEEANVDVDVDVVATWCQNNLEVTCNLSDFVLLSEQNNCIPNFRKHAKALYDGVPGTMYIKKTSVRIQGRFESKRYVLKGVRRTSS